MWMTNLPPTEPEHGEGGWGDRSLRPRMGGELRTNPGGRVGSRAGGSSLQGAGLRMEPRSSATWWLQQHLHQGLSVCVPPPPTIPQSSLCASGGWAGPDWVFEDTLRALYYAIGQ